MKSKMLALLSVSVLIILSGCTSSESSACEAAKQAATDYLNEANAAENKLDIASDGTITNQNREEVIVLLQAMNDLTLKSYKVMVNNQSCFSPKEVVEAQTKLGD
jgi:ABC-type enterochelin transport system substrate-binding protein